ncbi:MAG: hypothetical protein H6724_08740 [Sandaracinus sp.]|nr:hypothetical protein [Sandaracinus sp.]
MLRDDPEDHTAVEGLREALASGDPERIGEQPDRLIEVARHGHERRGELQAVAWLIEVELEGGDADPRFQAALYRELGRLAHEELLDDAKAQTAYRKAHELDPSNEEVELAIEEMEHAAEKWRAIADRFLEEAKDASDPALKASLAARAGGLVWQYRTKGKNKEVDKIFSQALKADPSSVRAARLYSVTLKARSKWSDAAKTLRTTADVARNRDEKLNLYVEAARLFATKCEDEENASACFERVLDLSPGHEGALRFLVDYFTRREEWDHLVALYEDALRSRQRLESEQGILLQLGMVHWRIRGHADAAEPYFARLRKIDPAHLGMLDFYRAYLNAKAEGEGAEAEEARSRLLTVLSDALRGAEGSTKLEVATELARLAQTSDATDRAIDAWKTVQRLDPANAEAGGALRELYRRGQKWNALVETMRAELDALPHNADDADVKKRRVKLLKELITIYRDELKLDAMAVSTYNQLLEEQPEDVGALSQLAETYESMGRWNDLIGVLGRMADATEDQTEQVTLLMRVARLWIDRFANYNQATKPLEQVVELEPENREALGELKTIYTKKRSWKQLYGVLEKEARLASDPDVRFESTLELAKLAGERLHQHADAITLWKELLEQKPEIEGGLDTLEKLSEREKDWESLAWALERRVGDTTEPKDRIKLLQKLGTTYGDHLDQPAKAAEAWKRILELDPKNGRALRTLRDSFLRARDWAGLEALYAESNDWEGLVDVLGNAAERAESPEDTKELSFRAASVYVEKIGNAERAFRNYERVLSVDPKNVDAATALVPIYEGQGKWPQVVRMKEILVAAMDDAEPADRVAALMELSSLTERQLGDEPAAFTWARGAYALAPRDAKVGERLEAMAAATGAWAELSRCYEGRLANDDVDPEEATTLRRRLAVLAAEKLERPETAATQLEAVLAEHPTDTTVRATLERIYASLDRPDDVLRLKQHALQHATDDEARIDAWHALAVFHEQLEDTAAAIEGHQAALALDADNERALESLDRLLTGESRWSDLVSVLERRRELAPAERASLTLRLADLRREKLNDAAGALADYAEAVALEPTSDGARVGLEALAEAEGAPTIEIGRHLERAYEATGRHEALYGVLTARLEQVKDDDERRELQLRIAELAGTALGDADGAYAALESAFLDRPADPDLWDRLGAAADAAGKHEALAAAFATALEAAELDQDTTASLSRRIAEVYDVVIGEPAKSEPFHKRVLAHDPQDERSFLALKELYTEQERWDDLQALYRNRIAETVDAEAKRELLLQVCFLFEEILEDVPLAIRAYQEVVELDPDHVASRRALDRLYRRAGRFRDLVALLRQEIDRGLEADDEVARLLEIGEIHERELQEPSVAVDHYEQVLEREPSHTGAQRALERLLEVPAQRQRIAAILEPIYDGQGAFSDLARILRVQLEDVTEVGPRMGLLLRLASLEEEKLRSPEGAFSALSDAVVTDPSDASVREELARVATMRGADAERAEVLERAIGRAESSHLQAELLFEVAKVWDDRVGDPTRAESAYQRLIQAEPDNPDTVLPAARALERLHLGREAHAELAEDFRIQIRLELDAEKRRDLLARLATLLEDTLGDSAAAIHTHRRRLEEDPADLDALRSLERLYENGEDWQRLIGTLQSRDQVTLEEGEQRAIAARIAEVYETKLDDAENAIVAYNDALSRFGPDDATLAALARLYEKTERFDDLLEILEMKLERAEDESSRADLRFRMGEILRTKTRDVERAVDAYAQVLEHQPGHEGVVNALEEIVTDPDAPHRVEAARVLVPQLEGAQRWGDLIAVLEVAAETDDPTEKLRALRRAAEVAELGGENLGQAFELQARAVRVGVTEPDLPSMLEDLERFAAASGKHAEHADLLESVAPEVLDGDQQIEAYAKAASIARDRLEDVSRARRLLRRILELKPDDRGALDALESLQVQAGDHGALLETVRRKAELASDPSERIALLERQAKLCEEDLQDSAGAVDALEQILMEAPNHAASYASLERIHAAGEKWNEVVAVLERKLDNGVGRAVEVRHALATVHLERLSDARAALDQLRDGIGDDPSHQPTVDLLEKLLEPEETRRDAAEILEPVFLSRMDWQKVLSTLEARMGVTDDVEERKVILGKIGEILEDQREDLEGALQVYGRLFAEDPRDRASWETLARLARAVDGHRTVAEFYAAAVEKEGVVDEETTELARVAARTFSQTDESAVRAVDLWKRVLELEAADREAFDALEALYRRLEQPDALLDLYTRRVDVADSDEERVLLLHRAAELQESEAGDSDAAIATYRQALEVDPNDLGAAESLDRLLSGAERWADLADHLRFRIDGVAGTPEEADLKLRLADLLSTRLEDVTGAIDLLEENVQSRPDHAGSVTALEKLVLSADHQLRVTQILEPLYRAADQWKKLVAVLEAQASLADDAADKARLLGEVGRLHEERGNDVALAFDAWSRAFVVEPLDDEAKGEVDRLAGLLGAWDEHVATYEQAMAATDDAMRVGQLLGAVARVHDEKRGDPRAAIETYERLVKHDSEDLTALDALEALHTMVADWHGLVNVIDRKVERVFDPQERAELLRRAASVLEELLGDPAAAIRLYERAAQEDDQDPIALESLDRLYLAASNHEELARVLDRRMEVEEDEEYRVEVGVRLAQLLETQLSRIDDAIDAYRRLLDMQPDHTDALSSLGRLYERQAMWPELLENLKHRAGLAEQVADRVQLIHRAGEVTERELDDVPEALLLFEQALQLDGRHEASLQALVRISRLEDYRLQTAEVLEPLLLVQERWDLLADLRLAKAEVASDPFDKKRELRALAEIRENGLHDPKAAFDAMARAFAEDPADEEVAEELERLAAMTESYGRLADELTARAGAAFDPTVARSIFMRLARIAEERLSDRPRAIDAYQKALEQVGDDEELLAILDRLYTDAKAWTDLGGVLERRVNMAVDPTERAELLVRLGELREKEFGDLRGAFASYQEVVERDPQDTRALDGLQRLGENEELALQVVDTLEGAYRETGALDRIAALYDIRIALAGSDGERVQMLQEAARLWEDELAQPDKALGSLRKAFVIDPRDMVLLGDLERLATASGAWDSLRGLVEGLADEGKLDDDLARDLNLRAAGWYRDRLADLPAAEARFRAALDADGELPEAHEGLVEILRSGGREAELVAGLRTWAEVELDEHAKKERLREAARLAESALGDARLAGELYEGLLEVDPTDADALDALLRLRQGEARWDAVVSLLERRIDVEMDPDRRLAFRRQLAETLAGPLDDTSRAIEAFEAVLFDAPEDLETIAALEGLYEAKERWEDLRGLLDRRLDLAQSDGDRIAARVRLARLAEKAFGRRDDAMQQLREILEMDPRNGEALDELERLLELEGNTGELLELLEGRAADAAAVGAVEDQKRFVVRLAAIHEANGDTDKAMTLVQQVLTLDPQNVDAWKKLAEMREAAGADAEHVEALEKLRDLLSEDEAAELSLRIATLAEDKLSDPTRAAEALRRSLQLRPSDEVRTRLKGHLEKHGEWRELAGMLDEELAALTDDKAKVARLKELATIHREKLGDPATGATYLERAVDLTPEDRDVLLPLCDLYIAAGRQRDAIPVLEKIVESFGGRRSKELAGFHHRLGQAHEGLGDTEAALASYDSAFKMDLTNIDVLRDLGKLTLKTGDLARAQKTFRALLLQKLDDKAGITKADVYFYLGDISAKEGDAKKAISMLDRALAEQSDHAEAAALLSTLKS